MVIKKVTLFFLALILGLNFKSVLYAETKYAGAHPAQAATGSQTGQGAIGKIRPRHRRRAMRLPKCQPQASSDSKKSEETKPPTMDSPTLILDPTDREPGPPKEIIPKHIDPAEMPPVKKPPKTKTNPY